MKFVHGNVLFKFARDDKVNLFPVVHWCVQGFYQGRDELAQKAARCEIRNMNALIELGIFQLHTTLSAFFQIRGHGIVATALAPISAETLVHGSGDAGATFMDRSLAIKDYFKQVASF